MLKRFFSPSNKELYPPCGMFTTTHIIAFIVFSLLIAGGLFISIKKLDKAKIKIVTRVLAIVLTVLEISKIGYCFYYKSFNIDSWVPISYCSLFIYALHLAGFKNEKVSNIGKAYIGGGALIAGFFFLIFPTTSLVNYPIYHFLSLYSMLFHSLMVYLGVLYLVKGVYTPSLKKYKDYLIYLFSFIVIALVINGVYDSNLMFLSNPYNFPIKFIVDLYNLWNYSFTLIVIVAYSSLYLIILFVYKNILRRK